MGGVSAVGILHPGRMGSAVAAQAVRRGAHVLWCPTGRSPATARRAAEAGLHAVPDLAALLKAAELVLSVCPPAVAEEVATTVAGHGFRGVYVEANAISTARCARIAGRLAAAGAQIVDGGIIGPPPRDDLPARLYLAGEVPAVEVVHGLLRGTAVTTVALDGGIGAASALKMAYAGYQKAARALAGVSHALAARHGVTEHLLDEANRSVRSPLAEPGYLPSVAARAWRWGFEMGEVSDTLAVDGLPADLARAAAMVLDAWSADKDDWDIPLDLVLTRLFKAGHTGSKAD
jgi:3-hydroxyisobutyrate dehydrogenase-like beta-hydroxyacid dehydrogenase